jgi:hypothetical protein
MLCRNFTKIGQKILFPSKSKKAQKIAKWPNLLISGKLIQNRPNGNPELNEGTCPYNRIKEGILSRNIEIWKRKS